MQYGERRSAQTTSVSLEERLEKEVLSYKMACLSATPRMGTGRKRRFQAPANCPVQCQGREDLVPGGGLRGVCPVPQLHLALVGNVFVNRYL